jgi:hypothetical protein
MDEGGAFLCSEEKKTHSPMKLILLACSVLALNLSVFADDALELQRLQGAYNSAIQRAERPITMSYIQELSRLRDTYLAANRAAAAQQVEGEIKLMTDRIAAMDKTPPPGVGGPSVAGASRPATPPPAPVGQRAAGDARSAIPLPGPNGQPTVVFDGQVKVPANTPDGYPLGALRKGDVVTLQYIDGLWKAHGHVASDNPDLVREERNHQDESRMVIASAAKGRPGAVIALVPPLTAKTPFIFKVPEDRSDLVLRINKNSEDKGNPGVVTYQMKIVR